MPKNLESVRIVYTLRLWAPGRLESGSSDSGRLILEKLDAWTWPLGPKKLKLNFTVKGAEADYDIFNSRF